MIINCHYCGANNEWGTDLECRKCGAPLRYTHASGSIGPIPAQIAQATTGGIYPVAGIDVSTWQGQMDWAKALQAGARFAYIRAGFGNDGIDPQAARNLAECRRVGMPYGIYWYIKPDKDWRKTADAFAAAFARDGGALPPVFDVETSGGLNKTDLESWLYKCYTRFIGLTGLEMDGLVTYTSPGFLNANLGLTNWMKRTALWVAHWTTAAQPTIPNEWSAIANPKTWTFWQWSADGNRRGAEFGAQSDDIDLDRFNGDEAAFYKAFGVYPAIVPEPQPEPDPEPEPSLQIIETKVRQNVRAAPWSTIQAVLPIGLQLRVVGSKPDASGKTWYQVGDNLWLASWLVTVVEEWA